MPVKDIQISTHLSVQFTNPLITIDAQVPLDTLVIPKHQGSLTTAVVSFPLKLTLSATFFGSDPASTPLPPDDTSLDRGERVHLKVILSRRADSESDCLAHALFESTIDLSQKDSIHYFPADASLHHPFYYYNVKVNLPTITFPDYGNYLLKTVLRRDDLDRNFFIQSISPFHVLPPKN